MKKSIKNMLVGVLIGAVGTLGLEWTIDKYFSEKTVPKQTPIVEQALSYQKQELKLESSQIAKLNQESKLTTTPEFTERTEKPSSVEIHKKVVNLKYPFIKCEILDKYALRFYIAGEENLPLKVYRLDGDKKVRVPWKLGHPVTSRWDPKLQKEIYYSYCEPIMLLKGEAAVYVEDRKGNKTDLIHMYNAKDIVTAHTKQRPVVSISNDEPWIVVYDDDGWALKNVR